MKKAIALFLVLLALSACTNTNKEEKKVLPDTFPGDPEWMSKTRENTILSQYVDSITQVYPNYKDNIVVAKKICEDFEKHLGTMPGILKGSTFRFVSMMEKDGKNIVAFACNETGPSVWCMDYPADEAAKLDKEKAYEITGGSLDNYVPVDEQAGAFLNLGEVYVKGLKVEEI